MSEHVTPITAAPSYTGRHVVLDETTAQLIASLIDMARHTTIDDRTADHAIAHLLVRNSGDTA